VNLLPRPVASAIVIVVTVVWALNFALQFVVADYKSDVAINGIFMAIVGGAIALSRKGDPPPPPPPAVPPAPTPGGVVQ
jgi:hypothetical protein